MIMCDSSNELSNTLRNGGMQIMAFSLAALVFYYVFQGILYLQGKTP